MAHASAGDDQQTRSLAKNLTNDRLEDRIVPPHGRTYFEVLIAQAVCDSLEAQTPLLHPATDELIDRHPSRGAFPQMRLVCAVKDLHFRRESPRDSTRPVEHAIGHGLDLGQSQHDMSSRYRDSHI